MYDKNAKRETNLNEINDVIKEIKGSEFIKNMWENYSKQYSYANNVKLEDIIYVIEKISKSI